MQRLVTDPEPVLNSDGTPNAGYCTQETQYFHRNDIKANPFRIKEWDFYQIEDAAGHVVLQLTYGHASYMGEVNIMLFDVRRKIFLVNKTILIPLPMNSLHMPESAAREHTIRYHSLRSEVYIHGDSQVRDIRFRIDDVHAELHLTALTPHSLIINIPFDEDPHDFYYDFKQNCMAVTGEVVFHQDGKGKIIHYGENKPAYAILDWGRGVWPWHNEWYWSNGQGMINEKLLGFNLGCGFGNTSIATENILFYEGQAHKLDQIMIQHESDYMKPWYLEDNEGRCRLVMTPQYDRITRINFGPIENCTHQVFGLFNGTVKLDDRRELTLENVSAFAEHAVNNW